MKICAVFLLLLILVGCRQSEPVPPRVSGSPAPSEQGEPLVSGALQPDIQLDKEEYRPGEQINVMAVATGLEGRPWVGVVPAAVSHGSEEENDVHDLSYIYINETDHPFLVAPEVPGEYDVRFNDDDTDGREIASRSFRVVPDPEPVSEARVLWRPEGVLSPGQMLQVGFEVPLEYPKDAWIGIVPRDTPHGTEAAGDSADLDFVRLAGRKRGTVDLKAPEEEGAFDVRIYSSDSNGAEGASVPFEVGAPGS